MQRTVINGVNGQDRAGVSNGSPEKRSQDMAEVSRAALSVDRATSCLNRRILPHGVDGRSAAAKRLSGLVRDLAKYAEDPSSPITRARCVAAALLIMEQESLAHALAAGKVVSADEVVRVAHATERALARLK